MTGEEFAAWANSTKARLSSKGADLVIIYAHQVRKGAADPGVLPPLLDQFNEIRKRRDARSRLIDHPLMGLAVSAGNLAKAVPVDEETRKNVFYKTIIDLKLGPVAVGIAATWINPVGGAVFGFTSTALQKGGEEALKALKSGATDEAAQKKAMLTMFGAGTAKAAAAPVDMLMGMLNLTTKGAAAPVVAVATELMKKGLIPATLAAFETVVENYMARATGLDRERDLTKDAWKAGALDVLKEFGTRKQ